MLENAGSKRCSTRKRRKERGEQIEEQSLENGADTERQENKRKQNK